MQTEGSEAVRRLISYSSRQVVGEWPSGVKKLPVEPLGFVLSWINTLALDSAAMLSWHDKQEAAFGLGVEGGIEGS